MWRICKACVLKDKLRKENPNEYEQWKANHEPKCNANYEGSSGGMEAFGSLQIFKRSIQKHGVRYVKYYSDGDSKLNLSKKLEIFTLTEIRV